MLVLARIIQEVCIVYRTAQQIELCLHLYSRKDNILPLEYDKVSHVLLKVLVTTWCMNCTRERVTSNSTENYVGLLFHFWDAQSLHRNVAKLSHYYFFPMLSNVSVTCTTTSDEE